LLIILKEKSIAMTNAQRNLTHIYPAIKQFDQTSCWAACIDWWVKARKLKIARSGQIELLIDYSNFWNSDGTISQQNLKQLLEEKKWKAKTILVNPNLLCHSYIKKLLNNGPIIVAFIRHDSANGHTNVIIAPSINEAGHEEGFIIMEPENGTYRKRTYGSYSTTGYSTFFAVPEKTIRISVTSDRTNATGECEKKPRYLVSENKIIENNRSINDMQLRTSYRHTIRILQYFISCRHES
jgi:hypothetical protein